MSQTSGWTDADPVGRDSTVMNGENDQNVIPPMSSTMHCSMITASFNGEERFDWTKSAGLRVLIPSTFKFEAFERAPASELRNGLISQSEIRDSHRRSAHQLISLPEKDEAWWFAQLVHYGLPVTANQEQAKESIKMAILEDRLIVPQRLLDLENRLKRKYITIRPDGTSVPPVIPFGLQTQQQSKTSMAQSAQKTQETRHGQLTHTTGGSSSGKLPKSSTESKSRQAKKKIHLNLSGQPGSSSSSSSSSGSDSDSSAKGLNHRKATPGPPAFGMHEGRHIAKPSEHTAPRNRADESFASRDLGVQPAAHFGASPNRTTLVPSTPIKKNRANRVDGLLGKRASGQNVTPTGGLSSGQANKNSIDGSRSTTFHTPSKVPTSRDRERVQSLVSDTTSSSGVSSENDDDEGSVIFQSSTPLIKSEHVASQRKKQHEDLQKRARPASQNTKVLNKRGEAGSLKTKTAKAVMKNKKPIEISSDSDESDGDSEETSIAANGKRLFSTSQNKNGVKPATGPDDISKHQNRVSKNLKSGKRSGVLSNIRGAQETLKKSDSKGRKSVVPETRTEHSDEDEDGSIALDMTDYGMNEVGDTDPESDARSTEELILSRDTPKKLKATVEKTGQPTDVLTSSSDTVSGGLQAALEGLPSYLRGHTRYDSPELSQSTSTPAHKTREQANFSKAHLGRQSSAAPTARKRSRPSVEAAKGSEPKRPRLNKSLTEAASATPGRAQRAASEGKPKKKEQRVAATSGKGKKHRKVSKDAGSAPGRG